MEYADNGTLAQYLNNPKNAKEDGLFAEKDIISMFSQIVSGIRYMHEQNILHRDLKTANIFMTKEGYIKIGDFGVSKVMDSHKAANTVLGIILTNTLSTKFCFNRNMFYFKVHLITFHLRYARANHTMKNQIYGLLAVYYMRWPQDKRRLKEPIYQR